MGQQTGVQPNTLLLAIFEQVWNIGVIALVLWYPPRTIVPVYPRHANA